MRKAATIRTAAAGAAAALLLTTYGLTPALAGTSGPRHAVANGGDQVNYGQLAANAVAEGVESAVSAGHLSGFAGDEATRGGGSGTAVASTISESCWTIAGRGGGMATAVAKMISDSSWKRPWMADAGTHREALSFFSMSVG